MSKIKEWADNATDQEIVAVMTEQNHRQGMALFSCLTQGDERRVVNIHRHIGSRLVEWITSDEWVTYVNHEEMLPEYAKAEFTSASAAPEVGSLHGSALIVSNENPGFPTCLKEGRLQPVLNYDLSQYQWAPTAEEAKESKHYELGNYDAYMLSEAWKKRAKGEV